MESGKPGDLLDTKVLGQLRAGTAHMLGSKSGVPSEDLHQYLYLQAEKSTPDQTSRQMDLVSILEALVQLRGLLFKPWSFKLNQLPELYGLLCSGKTV
jgi:hypothetical protein